MLKYNFSQGVVCSQMCIYEHFTTCLLYKKRIQKSERFRPGHKAPLSALNSLWICIFSSESVRIINPYPWFTHIHTPHSLSLSWNQVHVQSHPAPSHNCVVCSAKDSLQNRRLFLHSVVFWSSEEEEEEGALENCTPPLSLCALF